VQEALPGYGSKASMQNGAVDAERLDTQDEPGGEPDNARHWPEPDDAAAQLEASQSQSR
jgi:hypothetical protein